MSALARIPKPLADAGVCFEEGDLIIPPALREQFNVLLPVKRLGSSNTLYTPGVSGIKLDPRRHAYPQGKKNRNGPAPDDELALSKDGLLALAEAAGLIGAGPGLGTSRIARGILGDGEIGWQCTLGMRQSDGTIRPLPTASRIIDIEVEREKIELEVESTVRRYADRDHLDTEEKITARIAQRVRERWVKEREHFDSKCETKAVLRAVRAALQVPQKFTRAELDKPFLVATYNFTPDLSDPEVRRMLTAAAIGAQASIYGGASSGALPPADDDARALTAGDAEDDRVLPQPEAGSPGAASPAAADFDGDEPGGEEIIDVDVVRENAGPDEAMVRSSAAASAASGFVVGFGKHRGKTIGEIGGSGGEGADYVRWISESARDEDVRAAAAAWWSHLEAYGEAA